jgi:hypothetical protein
MDIVSISESAVYKMVRISKLPFTIATKDDRGLIKISEDIKD